jgi:hypothetical protein
MSGPLTRFADFERLRARVRGCPLASLEGGSERTCASCPYNLIAPGQPTIGCETRTPAPVLSRALTALEGRDASLAAQLHRLQQEPRLDDPARAASLQRSAEVWFTRSEGADAESEREVAAIVARFARAVVELGEPVEVLA